MKTAAVKNFKNPTFWPRAIQEEEENIGHKHHMIQKTVMQPEDRSGIRRKKKELL